jgi:hypothetical protein
MGRPARLAPSPLEQLMERPMPQPNDLSRSLLPLAQDRNADNDGRRAEGATLAELARSYDVGKSAISRLIPSAFTTR